MWIQAFYFFPFIEQVLIPKRVYKGQKLIKEVATKIIAKVTSVIPIVPLIILPK